MLENCSPWWRPRFPSSRRRFHHADAAGFPARADSIESAPIPSCPDRLLLGDADAIMAAEIRTDTGNFDQRALSLLDSSSCSGGTHAWRRGDDFHGEPSGSEE